MLSPRQLALTALDDVFTKGRKPRDSLGPLSEGLERRDRAFLMELVYGVIRYRDTLDWILKKLLQKPRMPRGYTLNNLRCGIYQIFFMRVPDWAAVNEAVNMERRNRGLVNAVLRNALRRQQELDSELKDMEDPESPESISVLTSHPLWLIKRWIKRFGPEEAYRLARANNIVPQLTLRVNTLRASRQEVLKRLGVMGIGAEPTALSPDGIRIEGRLAFGELEDLGGLVLAQDEAAQLIALMLGPLPGERVLDACAAPGGKTTHIAQLMKDTGEVVAVDMDEGRIRVLEENISSLGPTSVKVLQADVTKLKGLAPFDRVLLDAPCTALGTIRRNPDVKYRHGRGDPGRFGEKQLAMLRSVSAMVKPGGTLVFCTCSTEPEEGEDVVREFLKTSGDFFIIKDAPVPASLLRDGLLRTFTHRHGTDGFFGARMKKRT
jgi:16S rRNA (cytosine967-C5)-methyltransferase